MVKMLKAILMILIELLTVNSNAELHRTIDTANNNLSWIDIKLTNTSYDDPNTYPNANIEPVPRIYLIKRAATDTSHENGTEDTRSSLVDFNTDSELKREAEPIKDINRNKENVVPLDLKTTFIATIRRSNLEIDDTVNSQPFNLETETKISNLNGIENLQNTTNTDIKGSNNYSENSRTILDLKLELNIEKPQSNRNHSRVHIFLGSKDNLNSTESTTSESVAERIPHTEASNESKVNNETKEHYTTHDENTQQNVNQSKESATNLFSNVTENVKKDLSENKENANTTNAVLTRRGLDYSNKKNNDTMTKTTDPESNYDFIRPQDNTQRDDNHDNEEIDDTKTISLNVIEIDSMGFLENNEDTHTTNDNKILNDTSYAKIRDQTSTTEQKTHDDFVSPLNDTQSDMTDEVKHDGKQSEESNAKSSNVTEVDREELLESNETTLSRSAVIPQRVFNSSSDNFNETNSEIEDQPTKEESNDDRFIIETETFTDDNITQSDVNIGKEKSEESNTKPLNITEIHGKELIENNEDTHTTDALHDNANFNERNAATIEQNKNYDVISSHDDTQGDVSDDTEKSEESNTKSLNSTEVDNKDLIDNKTNDQPKTTEQASVYVIVESQDNTQSDVNNNNEESESAKLKLSNITELENKKMEENTNAAVPVFTRRNLNYDNKNINDTNFKTRNKLARVASTEVNQNQNNDDTFNHVSSADQAEINIPGGKLSRTGIVSDDLGPKLSRSGEPDGGYIDELHDGLRASSPIQLPLGAEYAPQCPTGHCTKRVLSEIYKKPKSYSSTEYANRMSPLDSRKALRKVLKIIPRPLFFDNTRGHIHLNPIIRFLGVNDRIEKPEIMNVNTNHKNMYDTERFLNNESNIAYSAKYENTLTPKNREYPHFNNRFNKENSYDLHQMNDNLEAFNIFANRKSTFNDPLFANHANKDAHFQNKVIDNLSVLHEVPVNTNRKRPKVNNNGNPLTPTTTATYQNSHFNNRFNKEKSYDLHQMNDNLEAFNTFANRKSTFNDPLFANHANKDAHFKNQVIDNLSVLHEVPVNTNRERPKVNNNGNPLTPTTTATYQNSHFNNRFNKEKGYDFHQIYENPETLNIFANPKSTFNDPAFADHANKVVYLKHQVHSVIETLSDPHEVPVNTNRERPKVNNHGNSLTLNQNPHFNNRFNKEKGYDFHQIYENPETLNIFANPKSTFNDPAFADHANKVAITKNQEHSVIGNLSAPHEVPVNTKYGNVPTNYKIPITNFVSTKIRGNRFISHDIPMKYRNLHPSEIQYAYDKLLKAKQNSSQNGENEYHTVSDPFYNHPQRSFEPFGTEEMSIDDHDENVYPRAIYSS